MEVWQQKGANEILWEAQLVYRLSEEEERTVRETFTKQQDIYWMKVKLIQLNN